jgi:hypothetical protein
VNFGTNGAAAISTSPRSPYCQILLNLMCDFLRDSAPVLYGLPDKAAGHGCIGFDPPEFPR